MLLLRRNLRKKTTYNNKTIINILYLNKTYDISKIGANVVTMSRKEQLLHHASSEDIMMMLSLMNPKYYVPVIGEYRHMVANAKCATHVGMPKENILLKQNGDVITFINGKLVGYAGGIDRKDKLLELEKNG